MASQRAGSKEQGQDNAPTVLVQGETLSGEDEVDYQACSFCSLIVVSGLRLQPWSPSRLSRIVVVPLLKSEEGEHPSLKASCISPFVSVGLCLKVSANPRW